MHQRVHRDPRPVATLRWARGEGRRATAFEPLYRRPSRYRRRAVLRPWMTPLMLAMAVYGCAGALASTALGSAGSAAAQDSADGERGAQPLADARLAPVRARLLAASARARADGVPAEWLDAKVREGLAKHVPAARIAAAVEQLAERIHEATTIARTTPVSGRTEVARAVLDALAAGARVEPLAALVGEVARDDANASEDSRAALRVVAELGERGFAADLATESTRAAWRNGGREGLRALLEAARHIPRSEASASGDALQRAANAPRPRGAQREQAHGDATERDRPSEHAGPPRDDSFTHGASHGRALGHTRR